MRPFENKSANLSDTVVGRPIGTAGEDQVVAWDSTGCIESICKVVSKARCLLEDIIHCRSILYQI
jgi:hypothetical protein